MQQLVYLFLFVFLSKDRTSTEVLKKMYERYGGKWHKTLHFIQDTERYRNDSLIKKDTWYEAMLYPDLFRIDFGAPNSGNALMCNADSAYHFKDGKLASVTKMDNPFIFLLGGMYSIPFDKVLEHMKELHVDITKCHSSKWKGQAVYVIGADADSDGHTQLWIDQSKLVPVRYLEYTDGNIEDAVLENHIQLKGGWIETLVHFYKNGKLLQIEKYHDCVVNEALNKRIFDPKEYGKAHWYKK